MTRGGTKKAPGYVIGEKVLNYIRASDSNSDLAQNIPAIHRGDQIFTTEELREYFATARRVGVAGHVATDAQYETMCGAGMFDDDLVSGGADAILFERARVLLLGANG